MGRKCFISFKTEDIVFKKYIQEDLKIDMVDKSLNEPINSLDEDYILQRIRDDYLSDSTVTIYLIGSESSEAKGINEQRFIKRELQASLYHGKGNTQNGILGIVLPSMYEKIFGQKYLCSCGKTPDIVLINYWTTINEFSCNYYIQNSTNTKCCWEDDERYCILTKWDDFVKSPEEYIEQAYQKRFSDISNRVKVRP